MAEIAQFGGESIIHAKAGVELKLGLRLEFELRPPADNVQASYSGGADLRRSAEDHTPVTRSPEATQSAPSIKFSLQPEQRSQGNRPIRCPCPTVYLPSKAPVLPPVIAACGQAHVLPENLGIPCHPCSIPWLPRRFARLWPPVEGPARRFAAYRIKNSRRQGNIRGVRKSDPALHAQLWYPRPQIAHVCQRWRGQGCDGSGGKRRK